MWLGQKEQGVRTGQKPREMSVQKTNGWTGGSREGVVRSPPSSSRTSNIEVAIRRPRQSREKQKKRITTPPLRVGYVRAKKANRMACRQCGVWRGIVGFKPSWPDESRRRTWHRVNRAIGTTAIKVVVHKATSSRKKNPIQCQQNSGREGIVASDTNSVAQTSAAPR